MKTIASIGIDLSKNNYQVCAVDSRGNIIFNRNFKDIKLIEYFQVQIPLEIGIEAGRVHIR